MQHSTGTSLLVTLHKDSAWNLEFFLPNKMKVDPVTHVLLFVCWCLFWGVADLASNACLVPHSSDQLVCAWWNWTTLEPQTHNQFSVHDWHAQTIGVCKCCWKLQNRLVILYAALLVLKSIFSLAFLCVQMMKEPNKAGFLTRLVIKNQEGTGQRSHECEALVDIYVVV